jgi:hypothetical protein
MNEFTLTETRHHKDGKIMHISTDGALIKMAKGSTYMYSRTSLLRAPLGLTNAVINSELS